MKVSSKRPNEQGFTLIEMLVVVAVIIVSVGLAAPTISATLAERKKSEAALDLVRVARRARSEAAAYGRAHLLHFDSNANGSLFVFRGINGGCNTNDWNTIRATACDTPGNMCVDAVAMGSGRYGETVMASPLGDTFQLCFEPSGLMRWRTDLALRFTDRNAAGGVNLGGGVQFQFDRFDDGTREGVTRWAVLPLGGEARIRR